MMILEDWEEFRTPYGQVELRRRVPSVSTGKQARDLDERVTRTKSKTNAVKAAAIGIAAAAALMVGTYEGVIKPTFRDVAAAEQQAAQGARSLQQRIALKELQEAIDQAEYLDNVPEDGFYLTMQSVPVHDALKKDEFHTLQGLEKQLAEAGLDAEHMKVDANGQTWARLMASTSYRTLLEDYQKSLQLAGGSGWKKAHVIEVVDGKTSWHDLSNLDWNAQDEERIRNLPFAEYITKSARSANVSAALLATVISIESGFDPNAISSTGCRGLAQLSKGVAKDRGVNRYEIESNVLGGARQLRWLLDQFNGDFYLTVAAYNAGRTAVNQSVAGTRTLDDQPKEYLPRAIKVFSQLRRTSGATKQSLTLVKDAVTASYRQAGDTRA